MKKLAVAFSFFIALNGLLWAVDPPTPLDPFENPSVRGNGMGGEHVAFVDGIDALFVNPAELRQRNSFSLLSVQASLINPAWINNAVLAYQKYSESEKLTDLTSLLSKAALFGVDIRGPLAFGFTVGGFGFSLTNRIYTSGRVVLPYVTMPVNIDVVANIGYAFRLIDLGIIQLDVGAVAKVFGRGAIKVRKNILDVLGTDDGLDNAINEYSKDIPIIGGGGFDLGASLRLGLIPDVDQLTVSVVAKDIFSIARPVFTLLQDDTATTTTTNEVYAVPQNIKLGASYRINLGSLLRVGVAADYTQDLTTLFQSKDEATEIVKDPLLNLSVGAELTLLGITTVRVGISDLLPAFGVGLNLGIAKVNAAIYGKELGSYPGDKPTTTVDVGVNFAW
ncbi:MAG: hypothetical protein LBQ77_04915 [Treponema sp.]|jgi:hypothetical protein|nr:hypothetical protein [Treponema sp.]